jgi:excisionase family DNA binding protein
VTSQIQRRLLKTKAACEYLGLSAWKMRDLVRAESIPVVCIDSDFRFDIRDLDKWIDRHKQTGA